MDLSNLKSSWLAVALSVLAVAVVIFMKYGLGLSSSNPVESVIENVAEEVITKELGAPITVPNKAS